MELVAALGPLAAALSGGGLPERWCERFPPLTRLRFESDRRGCSQWLAAVAPADTAARDLAASDDECRALARMLPVSAPGSAAAMVVAKLGMVRAALV